MSTVTDAKRRLLIALAGVAVLVLLIVLGLVWETGRRPFPHRPTSYSEPPEYVGEIKTGRKRPVDLLFVEGEGLYVVYAGQNEVELLSSAGKLLRRTSLGEAVPTSLAVVGDRLYVTDKNLEVRSYTKAGQLRLVWGWLPGKRERIGAHRLSANRDQLYIVSRTHKAVLVLSAVTTYGRTATGQEVPVTEEGELITAAPERRFRRQALRAEALLRKPNDATVSPDGRVLVSDAGVVKAYSCIGQFADAFEAGRGRSTLARPGALAYDSSVNPEVAETTTSVDPSGIRQHGRVHVVDEARAEVFVFATTGKFLFTYGSGRLRQPTGIAVDKKNRLIFVADRGARRISVWGY